MDQYGRSKSIAKMENELLVRLSENQCFELDVYCDERDEILIG